jgi:predicted acylesterase/phospholipase RssA
MTRPARRDGRTGTILIFQGGGALGAFECGVYKALGPYLKQRRDPLSVVAGTSIGAINAAFVASRYERCKDGGADDLDKFWRHLAWDSWLDQWPGMNSRQFRAWTAVNASLWQGNPRLFRPRVWGWQSWLPMLWFPYTSFYDTQPMRTTITQALGGGDVYQQATRPRLIMTAVELEEGRPVCFDSATMPIHPAHVLASCSLPPYFPATEIEGKHYWDGGLWTNTPLPQVLDAVRQHEQREDLYRVYIIDSFPQKIVPPDQSVPENNWAVWKRINEIAFQDKTRYDERGCEWVDTCIELYEALESIPGSEEERLPPEVRTRIARAKVRYKRYGNRLTLQVHRISRKSEPFEHISADIDFSSERIDELIRQGEGTAMEFLKSVAAGAGSPSYPRG